MPGNLLTADTSFPTLTEDMSHDEKTTKILNYLYMLLEQLRYSMSNLGQENFNDAEFESIVNLITEPIYVQLKDDEGNISALQVTAESLTSRVTNAEGSISVLQQTADSLSSRISSNTGSISALTQTAESLTSRVANAEGSISALTQTVNGITLSVESSGDKSVFRLTSGSAELTSATLNLSGYVTFTNLEDSTAKTVINGGSLSTAEISASTITGGTVSGTTVLGSELRGSSLWSHSNYDEDCVNNGYSGYFGQTIYIENGEVGFSYLISQGRYSVDKLDFGAVYADYDNSRMYFESRNGYVLKLQSDSNMSLEAKGMVYILASGTEDGSRGVTIRVPTGSGAPIRIQDNTGLIWEFADGVLYREGLQVLPVPENS